MSFVAALLLALLGALTPATAPHRAHVVAAAAARDTIRHEIAPAQREAIRAAQAPATLLVARLVDGGSHAPPPGTASAAPNDPRARTIAARAPPSGCERSHVVATRGTLRPYYPTAPPLQG